MAQSAITSTTRRISNISSTTRAATTHAFVEGIHYKHNTFFDMTAETHHTTQASSLPQGYDPGSGYDTFLTSETSLDSQQVLTKPAKESERAEHPMDVHRSLALAALALCYVGSQITSFFGGTGLNYIAGDLNIGQERSWINNCGSVATAGIVPVSGYIQDLIGRRGSLAAGLALSIIGVIINATAYSFAQLLVGGVINGIGSGMQELATLAS